MYRRFRVMIPYPWRDPTTQYQLNTGLPQALWLLVKMSSVVNQTDAVVKEVLPANPS